MYGFDLICSSFYLSKSGHFWICSSFSQHNDTYSAIDYNWKKRRWCAWDSNPGPQDVRRRRIHWAMASPSFLLPLPLISHECSTSTASLASSSYCCAPHPSIVRTYVRRWVVIRAHVSHTRVSEFRRLIRGERNWEQSLSHQAEAAHNNFPSANDDEETGAAKHTSTILSLSLSLAHSQSLSGCESLGERKNVTALEWVGPQITPLREMPANQKWGQTNVYLELWLISMQTKISCPYLFENSFE